MTTKIMSIILLLSMGFMACKKESTTEPKTNSTQEKLVGKWNLVSSISNNYYGGTSHRDTLLYSPGDYAEFRSDGKYYAFTSGLSITTDYGIANDSQIWLGYPGNVYDLKSFTTTGLQLYHKEVTSSTEYYESNLALAK